MNRDGRTLTLSAREIEHIAQHMLRDEYEVRLWLWREGYSDARAGDQRAMVAAQIWLALNDPARQRARAARGGSAVPTCVDVAVQIALNSMRVDRQIAGDRNALQVKHKLGEHVAGWSAACSLDPLPPDSDLLHADWGRRQPARPTPGGLKQQGKKPLGGASRGLGAAGVNRGRLRGRGMTTQHPDQAPGGAA